jgi:uncharacterized membrane protein
MMTKIKYALSFVLGGMYISGIWYLVLNPLNDKVDSNALQVLSTFLVVLGGFLIALGVIYFFVKHWGEK